MSLFGDICCLFSCSPRRGGNIPPENVGVRLSPVMVYCHQCYYSAPFVLLMHLPKYYTIVLILYISHHIRSVNCMATKHYQL